jgi:hypothetical protein
MTSSEPFSHKSHGTRYSRFQFLLCSVLLLRICARLIEIDKLSVTKKPKPVENGELNHLTIALTEIEPIMSVELMDL